MSHAFAKSRRSLVALTSLILICGIAVGGVLPQLLGEPLTFLRMEPLEQDSSPLLCATECRTTLRIVNTNWLKSIDLSRIGTSCGCLEIVSFPDRIESNGAGLVRLSISPGPYEDHAGVTLTLVGSGGAAIEHPFAAPVVPPFQGWPKHAEGKVLHGKVELTIDRRYGDVLERALLFGAAGEELEMVFDRERHVFSAANPAWENGAGDFVLVFKSGRRWAGPFVFHDPGLKNAP